jgi:hypothetical protein
MVPQLMDIGRASSFNGTSSVGSSASENTSASMEAAHLVEQGHQANALGDTVAALDYFRAAFALTGRCTTRISMANMLLKLGEPSAALQEYEALQSSAEALPDTHRRVLHRKMQEAMSIIATRQLAAVQAHEQASPETAATPDTPPHTPNQILRPSLPWRPVAFVLAVLLLIIWPAPLDQDPMPNWSATQRGAERERRQRDSRGSLGQAFGLVLRPPLLLRARVAHDSGRGGFLSRVRDSRDSLRV